MAVYHLALSNEMFLVRYRPQNNNAKISFDPRASLSHFFYPINIHVRLSKQSTLQQKKPKMHQKCLLGIFYFENALKTMHGSMAHEIFGYKEPCRTNQVKHKIAHFHQRMPHSLDKSRHFVQSC